MKTSRFRLFPVFLVFMIPFLAHGQKKKTEEEIMKMVWLANDPAQKVSFDADKYKDQSAVIIYEKNFFDYRNRGKYVSLEKYLRIRVKILDKSALEEFASFKYDEPSYFKLLGDQATYRHKGKNIFKIKVIKPSGKEILIDVKKNSVKEDGINKIAIPNLEVGDYVDYFYYNNSSFRAPMGYDFSPVQFALNSDYPILKYELRIYLSRKFYFNFNSYNGAPKLKGIGGDKKRRFYVLRAENIEPRKSKRWVFPLVDYPSVKFQVHFIPSSSYKQYAYAFLAKDKGVVKRNVTKQEVLDIYKHKFTHPFPRKVTPKDPVENFKKYYENIRSNETRWLYISLAHKKVSGKPWKFGYGDLRYTNPATAMSDFSKWAEARGLKHEVILVKKRPKGKIEDLLIRKNLRMMMRIHFPGGKTLYVQPFYDDIFFGIAGDTDPYLEGNTAYALKLNKRGVVTSIEKITLPYTSADDNLTENNIKVSFGDQFGTVHFDQKRTAKGHAREFWRNMVVSILDVYEQDQKERNYKQRLFKKYARSFQKDVEAAQKKEKDKTQKLMEDFYGKRFNGKVENYDFTVDNLGRTYKDPDFRFHEHFDVKDGFIKKAGKNIIFNIGNVIGKQIKIEEKEMERKENIHKTFANKTLYHIEVEVPAGYSVIGLEKLNLDKENETGKFHSEAKLENGKIIIEVEETYPHIFEPNTNWKKLVEILNTSYQFSQQKVLFKKQ